MTKIELIYFKVGIVKNKKENPEDISSGLNMVEPTRSTGQPQVCKTCALHLSYDPNKIGASERSRTSTPFGTSS